MILDISQRGADIRNCLHPKHRYIILGRERADGGAMARRQCDNVDWRLGLPRSEVPPIPRSSATRGVGTRRLVGHLPRFSPHSTVRPELAAPWRLVRLPSREPRR
jgi:hypothetical protein